MNESKNRCVLILDASLPLGLAANAAAILGLSLGRAHPELIGEDVPDASGCVHPGIIRTPVPVLRGDPELLRRLRTAAKQIGLTVVDFSFLAQRSRDYGQFAQELSETPEGDLTYLALGLCGPSKEVARLTGALPLLR